MRGRADIAVAKVGPTTTRTDPNRRRPMTDSVVTEESYFQVSDEYGDVLHSYLDREEAVEQAASLARVAECNGEQRRYRVVWVVAEYVSDPEKIKARNASLAARLLDLHQPVDYSRTVPVFGAEPMQQNRRECAECRNGFWPCATVLVVNGAKVAPEAGGDRP